MREKITKRAVDALKAADRDAYLWDTEVTGFGCKVTPAGKKVYVFQYRTRSQAEKEFSAPKRVTLGRHGPLTPEAARALAAKLLLEVKAGGDPAASFRPSESPKVSALAERFLTEHLPGKKRPPRPSTVAYYEILFRCHVLPALGGKRVDAVTSADLERLHAAMRETPYIANRTLSLLQQAFDQAERWGWRPQHSNPALHMERYREDRRGARKEVMLAPAEMARLLTAIDEEEPSVGAVACAVLRVVFWTGWRIGEVLALEWANVDLKRGAARLLLTKTAAEEYRQLPTEAVSILERVPRVAGCPYVFPGQDLEGHLTTVRKPWARIRRRAGLDRIEHLGAFRIHDLRHNVVSWDVSRGVPLEIAGKNVGHRSRRSTEVYAHFAPDALKRAADERAAAMRAAVEGEHRSAGREAG
ncbi:MAG: tyrosine-type recombinase/integrase [Acidobacteria bacterium]|nr:tyrosine-type recombinase/integrase [Acidobacteriota bacterium]